MSDKAYIVLFICTQNSARTIMAEGLLNSVARGRFLAFSAGCRPAGKVSPLALQTLERLRIATEDFSSKGWEQFAAGDALKMGFVFTACDNVAGEVCPVWPGQPMTAHRGVTDSASTPGPPEEKAKAFWNAAVMFKRRINVMLALPLASLDRLASSVRSRASEHAEP